MEPTNSRIRVFDSDLHIVEPPDLFEKYLDKRYHGHIVRTSRTAYECAMPFFRIDNHVMPDFRDFPASLGPEQREDIITNSPRFERVINKSRVKYKRYYEMGWDGRTFLHAMDEEGVDLTVLYPTSALLAMGTDDIEPELAGAIARAYNDYLYDFCRADRKRLHGAAMVSVHDVRIGIEEAKRAVNELGFKSIFLRPNLVKGRVWYSDYYEPLWTVAEELGVPICFHEGIGASLPHAGDVFGSNIFLRHVACHPIEMMLTLMQFCGGGILERHPGLRVAFLEGNVGWAPWLLDRLDDHYKLEFGVTAATLPHPPSFYFKRQCYLSAECDENLIGVATQELGSKNMVFSTDFPHPDAKFPRAVQTFVESDKIDAATKEQILWDNCVALYGMQKEADGFPRASRHQEAAATI
ncbi:MAG: amidohydrolase family protein [Sulfurifustis sp.]